MLEMVTSNVKKTGLQNRSNEITRAGVTDHRLEPKRRGRQARQVDRRRPQSTRPSEPHPPTQANSPECLLPWVAVAATLSRPTGQGGGGGEGREAPVRFRCLNVRGSASRLRAGEPSGASRRCAQ